MLSELRLRHFRCFREARVTLCPAFNIFLGANGQGKTTLLEAACVLLRLQSQRSPSLMPLVQHGGSGFVVRGIYAGHELEFSFAGLRRRLLYDAVEQRTSAEYLRLARVVSFANADIELIRGGSEARRRYLDFLGLQMNESYRPTLRAYERALRARNALLKSTSPRPRERAAYDAPLIAHGSRLRDLREQLGQKLAPFAAEAYAQIAGRARERFVLTFVSGASDDLAADLERSRAEETRLRQTLAGPHRDDLELQLDGKRAAQFGSEGQQRSISLALKLAQARVLASLGAPPLLLLDDIFGELDTSRRNALLDSLPSEAQKMVTATSLSWRAELPSGILYELHDQELFAHSARKS